MIRNEQTGRFESTKQKTYKVYSDVLDKVFNSVEELEAAEEAHLKAEEAKKAAADTKKTEAEKVKEKITARVNAEATARKAKLAAYKAYLAELEKIETSVKEAKKAEKAELEAFCKKYGSFHDTIKIGDITYSCDYSTQTKEYVDPFERLLGLWF